MQTEQKLSFPIRLAIGIIAIPSLMLAATLVFMLINQNTESISFFEVVYALVGIFASYIALTGKKFF
ncbi:hypothetical protein [Paraglaciecola aestuariivivens]